jgi:hypothetical protein
MGRLVDDEATCLVIADAMRARHARELPPEEKFAIAWQLIAKAKRAGAETMEEYPDFLDGPEVESLFEMLGLSLDRSCTENDFVDRLLDLLMTHGKGWETVEREGASSPD